MNNPENQLLQEIEDMPQKVSSQETENDVLKMPYEYHLNDINQNILYLFKLNNLTDKDLERPDVKLAIKEVLLKCFESKSIRGNGDKESDRLSFNIPTEIILLPEVQEVLRDTIIHIIGWRESQARKLIERFDVTQQIRNSTEVKEKIKNIIATDESWRSFDAKDLEHWKFLEEFYNLPPDFFKSPEILESIVKKIKYSLEYIGNNSHYAIESNLNAIEAGCTLVPKEMLATQEIKSVAIKAITKMAWEGDSEIILKLINWLSLSSESIRTPETIEAAIHGVIINISNGNFNGKIEDVEKIREIFNLPEDSFKEAITTGFMKGVSYGNFDRTEVIEKFDLDKDFIETPEFIQAARGGVYRQISPLTYGKDWMRDQRNDAEEAMAFFGLPIDYEDSGFRKTLQDALNKIMPNITDNSMIIKSVLDNKLSEEFRDQIIIGLLSNNINVKLRQSSQNTEWWNNFIEKIKNTYNISQQEIDDLTQSAVKNYLVSMFTGNNSAYGRDTELILKIKNEFGIPEETINSPEIKSTIIFQLLYVLQYKSESDFDTLTSIFKVEPENIESEEVRESLLNCLVSQIKENKSTLFLKTLDKFYVTSEVVSNVIEKSINEGHLNNVLRFIENMPNALLSDLEEEYGFIFYKNEIGILNEYFYKPYLDLVREKSEIKIIGYRENVKSRVSDIVSPGAQTESLVHEGGYKELVETIYPNNATSYTNFASNESCKDRSDDLDNLKIKPVYEISLGKGAEMILREGQEKDMRVVKLVEESITSIESEFKEFGFDKNKMLEQLDLKLEDFLTNIDNKELFVTTEEKIYALLLESLVGRFDNDKLKEIIVGYQFAVHEDIETYIEGTRDQVREAKNPDYVHLLEMREYFSDRIVEVEKDIINKAQSNPSILEILPQYYQEKTIQNRQNEKLDKLNRLRINKIGLNGNLISRILGEVFKKDGHVINYDESGKIIFEPTTQAVVGMIQSEKRKAAKAIEILTGKAIDPGYINLGELNLQEYMDIEQDISDGVYDEDLFLKYLTQIFEVVFHNEINLIDKELSKYKAKKEEQNKQRRKIKCLITKNHTSAHARAVGGVCVSGDNPSKGENCLWNMKNYFQMVLHDKTTEVCQGLVLLHLYETEEDGKVLTASFNPSSTYLYKVDESELFNKLLEQLSVFASENNIDHIVTSTSQTIRTNRTGGEFQKALDKTISTINKNIKLPNKETFSFHPNYQQQEMNVIWSLNKVS